MLLTMYGASSNICSIEKGWVLCFQRVKDRFVLPTFRSEYSDLLQGEEVALQLKTEEQQCLIYKAHG